MKTTKVERPGGPNHRRKAKPMKGEFKPVRLTLSVDGRPVPVIVFSDGTVYSQEVGRVMDPEGKEYVRYGSARRIRNPDVIAAALEAALQEVR